MHRRCFFNRGSPLRSDTPAIFWQPSGLRGAANRRRQDTTGIEEPLRRELREHLEHTRIYLAYMEGTKNQAPAERAGMVSIASASRRDLDTFGEKAQ